MLMADESLKEDLVVYTVGDLEGLPLQFNPFSVPPGVTVRNHTTRILAAFRAAYTMFDPVPAIYEGALERIYTDPRYTDGRSPMGMDEKGGLDSLAPTLSAFARAIQDELTEKALTLYQGSAESIGVIRRTLRTRGDRIVFCASPSSGCSAQRTLLCTSFIDSAVSAQQRWALPALVLRL